MAASDRCRSAATRHAVMAKYEMPITADPAGAPRLGGSPLDAVVEVRGLAGTELLHPTF